MKKTSSHWKRTVVLFLILLVFLFTMVRVSNSSGQYSVASIPNLDWNVIAGGSQLSSVGGDYSLNGTTGQPMVSYALVGTPYALQSGFWAGTYPYQVFLPVIKR